MDEGLRTHIASLAPSDQADAVIHRRAFAVLEAHGNTSMLSRQFGELLASAGLRACAPHESTGKTRSSRRFLEGFAADVYVVFVDRLRVVAY
jgi:hypothetical protein